MSRLAGYYRLLVFACVLAASLLFWGLIFFTTGVVA